MSQNTIWNEILKKEANGIDDNCDLGEIQKIEADYIVTVKGIINKLKFRIPKHLIAGFDGRTLYFGITKAQAKRYRTYKTSRFSS
jgi:hypothetical protein